MVLITDRTMTEWKQVRRKRKVLHTVKDSKVENLSDLFAKTVSRSVLASVKLYFTSVNYTQEQLTVLPVH